MRVLRRNGIDFESKRDPSGENLVVNIEAQDDEEQTSLEDLFR